MDENNNIVPNTSSDPKPADYTIGGPADYTIGGPASEPVAPVVESTPVVEAAPTVEPTPVVEAAPTVEPTPAAEPAPTVEPAPAVAPTPSEPTPQAAPNTASIYEQANTAATNPTANKVEETPIYTTPDNTSSSTTDSYSVPVAPTYASTDSTYSNTYNTTYDSTADAPASNGLAIASLVCGILSILMSCCCCGNILFSIGGIVCGCLQKPNAEGKKPGMALAGIITSIAGIVLVILIYALGFVFEEYLGDLSF